MFFFLLLKSALPMPGQKKKVDFFYVIFALKLNEIILSQLHSTKHNLYHFLFLSFNDEMRLLLFWYFYWFGFIFQFSVYAMKRCYRRIRWQWRLYWVILARLKSLVSDYRINFADLVICKVINWEKQSLFKRIRLRIWYLLSFFWANFLLTRKWETLEIFRRFFE